MTSAATNTFEEVDAIIFIVDDALSKGPGDKYIVDLLGEKRDKVIRSFIIEKDGSLLFPYLKEGSYCIRITEDLNRNNLVDTGNLLEHRQPEKVRFYKIEDQFLIKLPERTELVQTINMEEMFK